MITSVFTLTQKSLNFILEHPVPNLTENEIFSIFSIGNNLRQATDIWRVGTVHIVFHFLLLSQLAKWFLALPQCAVTGRGGAMNEGTERMLVLCRIASQSLSLSTILAWELLWVLQWQSEGLSLALLFPQSLYTEFPVMFLSRMWSDFGQLWVFLGSMSEKYTFWPCQGTESISTRDCLVFISELASQALATATCLEIPQDVLESTLLCPRCWRFH
jgi:hypothetical protein